jgi:leader peptidase (prepilin peptidase)/N-methyltransferase
VGVLAIIGTVAVSAWALALSVVDIRDRRLPNALTLPGAVALPALAATLGRGLPALAGAAALAGFYLVVHLAAPAAMGAGDVKLALGLGALTGAFGMDVWAWAALTAPLLTALLGLTRRRGGPVPHGPAMCLASLAAVAIVVL